MADTGLAEGVTYALLFVTLYFEVFLLVSFFQRPWRRRESSSVHASKLPTVAVVVPCFNEEWSVASTLNSLLALQYPQEKLEILVVDDGSTDRTLEIAKRFERARPVADAKHHGIRVFHKENGGKHTAMNLALANTDAELIGCLDADTIVHPDALTRLARVFENQKIAAVTPGIHVQKPENLLQHMQNAEYRLSIFSRFILAALGAVLITPGAFSFFRTRVVRELGGWRHGHSTEDMEMALRLQKNGHLIANAPAATVHTLAPRTLRNLFNQRVRWWYGWLRNAADYRFMIGNRRYGNLGLIIFPSSLVSIGAGIFLLTEIAWYAISTIARMIDRVHMTGVLPYPHPQLFYVNTSASLFLVGVSISLILAIICIGSLLGTGSRKPPAGTPLFLIFYAFLAPLWLGTALARVILRTGVSWR